MGGDFVAPALTADGPAFIGLKTGRVRESGAVSYTGADVSAKELLDKLTRAGADVRNVADTLASLDDFIEQLSNYRLGDVLTIARDPVASHGFVLVRHGRVHTGEKPRLP